MDYVCLPQPPAFPAHEQRKPVSSRIPRGSSGGDVSSRRSLSLGGIPQYQIPWSKQSDTVKDTDQGSDTRPKESPRKNSTSLPSSAGPTPTKKEARTQQAHLEEALEQIKTLQHENQRLLASKLASGKQLDAAMRAKEGLQNELTAARKEHFSSIREHITKAAELEECHQRLNEMAASSKASHATSEIYTRGLASSVATRLAAAKEKEEMTQALMQKDQALTALEEIVAELQGELQALQADQDLSLSQVQQLQENLARKSAAVAKLQKDVQAVQVELEEKEQGAQQQLIALKAEHEGAVQELRSLMDSQQEQHNTSLAAKEEQIAMLDKEYASRAAALEQQLQQSQELRAQLEAQVCQQRDHVAKLSEEAQQQSTLAIDLQARTQQQASRIADLEGDLQSSSAQVAELQAQLQARNTCVSELEAQLQSSSLQIEELQGRLCEEGKSASEREQQLQAHAQQLEIELGNSVARASGLEAQLGDATCAHAERTQQLEAELGSSLARASGLEAQLGDAKRAHAERMQQLEAELGSSLACASALEAQVRDATRAHAELRDNSEQALRAAQEQGEASKARVVAEKAAEMEELGAQHVAEKAADMEELKALHVAEKAAEVEELKAQYVAEKAAEIQKLKACLVDEKAAEMEELKAQKESELRAQATEFEEHAADVAAQHSAQLEAISTHNGSELQAQAAALAQQKVELEGLLGDAQHEKEEEVAHLREQLAMQEKLREEMIEKHQAELEAQQAELEQNHMAQMEQTLRKQEEAHAAALQERLAAAGAVHKQQLESEVEVLRSRWLLASRRIKDLEAARSKKKSGFGCFGAQGGVRSMGA